MEIRSNTVDSSPTKFLKSRQDLFVVEVVGFLVEVVGFPEELLNKIQQTTLDKV